MSLSNNMYLQINNINLAITINIYASSSTYLSTRGHASLYTYLCTQDLYKLFDVYMSKYVK